MKICVTAQGNTLDSQIDPRFGRCMYLLFVDSQTMQYTAILNKSANATGGAGIEAAKVVLEQGAQVIITGNPGPNAMQVLTAAGIKAVSYAMGTVREVVENYKSRPTS